jgi:hypothetical protein
MSAPIPNKIPPCAANLIARPEWYADKDVVYRANLSLPNWYARLLSSKRFSGRDDIWAITLGSTIYICMPDSFDIHSTDTLYLLAHEVKHVEQYEREGMANFFAKYIQSYAKQGGYGSAINFESEAYALGTQVSQHLQSEVAANPGIKQCLEMDDPHTANSAFVKTAPPVFRFPP